MPEPLQPSPPQISLEEKKAQASTDTANKTAHEEKQETVSTQAAPAVSEVVAQKNPSAVATSKPTGNKVTLAPLPEKTVSTGMLSCASKQLYTDQIGIFADVVDQETRLLTYDLDDAAKKLQNLEDLIDKTFSKESHNGT